MYEKIRYEVREGIATITFDRAEKLNAYTPEMGQEIVAAFEAAKSDDDVRVVILTGDGRAFCAGVDLDYLKAHMAGEIKGSGPALGQESFVREWPLELVAYPKPVIAAINGAAYGVGVTMTLGCDVRLAASGAKLGLNFAKIGVLPGLGSTHLLPQLVGISRALQLVMTAGSIDAEEAERIGLVQGVFPADVLLEKAREMAQEMAACRPDVLAAAKQALRYGAGVTVAEALRNEQSLSAALNAGRKK
jgi:2-(1,2-epoxy-1,2-dihydrophenyl)acetyl-CoA isomerase